VTSLATPPVRVAPEPLAHVDPPAARGLDSFAEVVAFVREKREMRLLYALENFVHLVSFERTRMELRLEPSAPPTLAGEISDRLSKWTGERWIVSVSGAEGTPTIAAQRQAHERARREAAEQDPLLKAAMSIFPGAKLVAVRDRETFDTPVEGGDGE
jgi:DNA polymerase-3 subunit gamma/tau